MSLEDIRATHKRLEEMKKTQSAKIVNELKSDAHRDRGILLEEVDKLQETITERDITISTLRSEIASFWGTAPKETQRAFIASGGAPTLEMAEGGVEYTVTDNELTPGDMTHIIEDNGPNPES